MIVFKVLLIVALVIPLIYISAVMMNSILDEVLKDKKDTKEKKDREKWAVNIEEAVYLSHLKDRMRREKRRRSEC